MLDVCEEDERGGGGGRGWGERSFHSIVCVLLVVVDVYSRKIDTMERIVDVK